MMTDDDKLAALFRSEDPIPDDGFTRRVVALAALEDRLAARRRAALERLGLEAVALVSIVTTFALLARLERVGEVLPLASPAMVGSLLLGTWLSVGVRGAVRGS